MPRLSSEKGKSISERKKFSPKISHFFAIRLLAKTRKFSAIFVISRFNLFREKMQSFSRNKNAKISRKNRKFLKKYWIIAKFLQLQQFFRKFFTAKFHIVFNFLVNFTNKFAKYERTFRIFSQKFSGESNDASKKARVKIMASLF